MLVLNWLLARLKERTSQGAIAYALATVVPVIQGTTDWRAVLPTLVNCLIMVLIPEGLGSFSQIVSPETPAGMPQVGITPLSAKEPTP